MKNRFLQVLLLGTILALMPNVAHTEESILQKVGNAWGIKYEKTPLVPPTDENGLPIGLSAQMVDQTLALKDIEGGFGSVSPETAAINSARKALSDKISDLTPQIESLKSKRIDVLVADGDASDLVAKSNLITGDIEKLSSEVERLQKALDYPQAWTLTPNDIRVSFDEAGNLTKINYLQNGKYGTMNLSENSTQIQSLLDGTSIPRPFNSTDKLVQATVKRAIDAANNAAQSVVNSAVKDALGDTFSQAYSNIMARKAAESSLGALSEPTAKELAAEASKILKGQGKTLDGVAQEAAKKVAGEAKDAATKAAQEVLGKGSEKGAEQVGNQAAQRAVKEAGTVEGSADAGAAEWLKENQIPYKVLQFNYGQYALLIWEAIKGTQIEDATKRVKVKGADPMNDSQGTPSSGASTEMPNAPMSGTTIADSANALITLLDMGKIDLSLLSTDIQKSTVKLKPAVTGSAGTSDGVEVKAKDTTLATTGGTLTSEEHKEILRRRALLLGEWATAATQIGEGSNAISSTFYERASAFAAAANAAQGSLGGISTITDTDRFVLFELTRSAALSAIQLGLQGAMNLNALDETASAPVSSAKPNVSIQPANSQ